MKIDFLGTAAYERIPSLFCNCDVCRMARAKGGKNIRSQCQTLIDDTLLIDFGMDNYFHFMRSGKDFSAVENLIITHSHNDHFSTGDFTAHAPPYAHNLKSSQIKIYGNDECYKKLLANEEAKGVSYTVVKKFETFKVDKYAVTAIPAHHNTLDPLCYIISDGEKTIFYSLDTGIMENFVYEWIKNQGLMFDLVISDCTLGLNGKRLGKRHMSLLENLDHKEKLLKNGVLTDKTVWVISHFSHNGLMNGEKPCDSDELQRIAKANGMIAAFDGMNIEI